MLLVAFTANKRFSVRATAPNETVDSQLFIDFVRHTGDKWRTLHSDPITLAELHWQMDNARPHCSKMTREFFENRQVSLVYQSPYSPDYNNCDRFIFNTLKAGLRQHTFNSHLEVEQEALRLLRDIPEEVLHRQVEELYDYCQLAINEGGSYVTD
jgi:DDE superfamily endonuclease